MIPFAETYRVEGDLRVEAYQVEVPLEKLTLGVDNLRYDVVISPEFIRIVDPLVFRLIIKHSGASRPLMTIQKHNWHLDISDFKDTCKKLMIHAVNQAKIMKEVQIDYLCQVAMVKLLVERINSGIEEAFQHFKTVVRKQELSRRSESYVKLREEVLEITRRRAIIVKNVCTEVFMYFNEARKDVDELRALNFGEKWLLPGEFFDNPLLHTVFHPDDFFMMNNYVLIGHRVEDSLNYHQLATVITSFLNHVLAEEASLAETQVRVQDFYALGQVRGRPSPFTVADRVLKNPGNMDVLFNYPETQRKAVKKGKHAGAPEYLKSLKERAKAQKRLAGKLYRTLRRENFLKAIAASYDIEEAIKTCCPPLMPQDVLRYAAHPRLRKRTLHKIKRFKNYSEKRPSTAVLKKTAARIRWCSGSTKERRMIRFMHDYSRYHRDLSNYQLYRETADCINLLQDNKDIRLSRDNHTLYEFILTREEQARKKPVINHAVVKADIRGSTNIVRQMKQKNLNPASNFSLHFFEPMDHLLSVFGAGKVFIEGDAAILCISEHKGDPDRWYGVARACGLAANILLVVKRMNHKNRKNNLPRLDLGIGISFSASAPTFFYDGDNPVMISPAINEADRLSECDPVFHRNVMKSRPPFNLQIFQVDTANMAGSELLPSPLLRYNVMGIELSAAGFKKLAGEIHLERLEASLPDFQKDPVVLYTGKYPTASGNYQRVIVREGDAPLVSPVDFSVVQNTGHKYYEVCTHPVFYEYVKTDEPGKKHFTGSVKC